jgi:RND family efflux transporter MFP subunit
MSAPNDPKPTLADLRIDHERRQPRRGALRPILIAVALLAVAVIVIAWFTAGGGPPEVAPATARSAAGAGPAAILNASGYVTPRRRATVAAKITGRVTEVLIDEGVTVEARQVLARLDDSDARARREATSADLDVARAALTELEVQLADAERTLRRARELSADGVASQENLDSAGASRDAAAARLASARERVTAARAQLEVADRDLENYTIRAPFAGIVVSKDAQPGEMVSPVSAGGGYTRTGIATIVDMASLEVEVDVNESYIARVEPGQPVESTLDAYPDWHIPSHVRTVIPTADRQKATVKVRISFDELDPRMLPDMGVKVAFLEEEQMPAAADQRPSVLVPAAAVRDDGEQKIVFVLKGDTVERRAVTIGITRGDSIEIVTGLAVGDPVVATGPAELVDGEKVRIAK